MYIAKNGFYMAKGKRMVPAGALFKDDDPDIKFLLKAGLVQDVVEAATAAPGERRAVSPPKSKKKPAEKKPST